MTVLWVTLYVLLALAAIAATLLLLLVLVGLVLRLVFRARTVADEVYAAETPDGWKLRLFRHRSRSGEGEPVLLVPGLIANHWEFEEPRGQSLVDHLSQRGFDCWILDPRGRRSATAPSGKSRNNVSWDDHIDLDLPTAIDYIRVATGFDRVHYVGHSLGGMLLYAFDACYGRDKIASAVTIGSPVTFKSISHKKFRSVMSFLRMRPLFSFFLRAITPFARAFRLPSRFLPVNWRNMSPRAGAKAFYNALDVPPYSLARELYESARTSKWRMKGGELDVDAVLPELETPIFAIFGAGDPLTRTNEAQAFYNALENDDKRLLILGKAAGYAHDYSHIDLVMGKKAREDVFEPIVNWLGEHPIYQRLDLPRPAKPAEHEAAETFDIPHAAPVGMRAEVVEPAPVRATGRQVKVHQEITVTEDDEVIHHEEENVVVSEVEFPDLPGAADPEEHEEGVPVLPGNSLARLARLAREVRDDNGGSDDILLAKPTARRKPAVKKWPGGKPEAATKKPAAKKPAAKPPVAPPKAAAKKPPAKRKPRPTE